MQFLPSVTVLSCCTVLSAALCFAEEKRQPPARFTPVDTSRVMGSPDPLPPIDVQRAFPNLKFDKPLQFVHAGEGSGRVFVCEQWGKIFVFPNQPDVGPDDMKLFLDISKLVGKQGWEEGLMSIAFHPKFKQNGVCYVYYTERPLASVVARYRVMRGDPDRLDTDSAETILTFPQPYANHNGGSMEFGPDGYLYIGLGDGGSGGDPHRNGQNLGTLLGSVLRIDVDRRDPGLKYAIPKDNPFAKTPGARGEIWAYGIRNIWRLSFDRLTGTLWAGDVGQDKWEEIDIIVRGGNYGWNLREGKHDFRPNLAKGDEKLIEPILDYDHSVGKSITGGIVYRGKQLPDLYGAYLYADFVSGRIWALRYDGVKVTSNIELNAPKLQISAFGEDAAGEAYLTAFDGYVYKLVPPKERKPEAVKAFPRKLSETGLFASIKPLRAVEGTIPYEVNVPLWSDRTLKTRSIALPKAASVKFDPTGTWEFPVGTVFVKTFSLPERETADGWECRRLETRLFLRNENGWEGFTYLWNDDLSEAQLLDAALTRQYEIRSKGEIWKQDYYFPSRADCLACHTAAAGHVLGMRTRQLPRKGRDGGELAVDQLRMLNDLGVFTRKLDDTSRYECYPDWPPRPTPTGEALKVAARAYLDANCAVCHQPGGSSITRVDLRYDTPLEKTGLWNVEPEKGRVGPDDTKLLVAGKPAKSELYLRMKIRGAGQMPNLATTVPDEDALKVVAAWIESLR